MKQDCDAHPKPQMPRVPLKFTRHCKNKIPRDQNRRRQPQMPTVTGVGWNQHGFQSSRHKKASQTRTDSPATEESWRAPSPGDPQAGSTGLSFLLPAEATSCQFLPSRSQVPRPSTALKAIHGDQKPGLPAADGGKGPGLRDACMARERESRSV